MRCIALLVCIICTAVYSSFAQADPAIEQPAWVGEWIVVPMADEEVSCVVQDVRQAGFITASPLICRGFIEVGMPANVPDTRVQIVQMESQLRQQFAGRLTVFPNRQAIATSSTREPNDTRYAQAQQTELQRIRAAQAWALTTGSPHCVLAIIDTGVDTTHPDLLGNFWTNPNEFIGNGIDDDNNGFVDDRLGYDWVEFDNDPQDLDGHGTSMAGIIGAVGNNDLGISGVNWSTSLMILKAGTTSLIESRIVYALDYAVKMKKNYHVPIAAINCSFRIFATEPPTEITPLREAVRRAGEADILILASAGNTGRNHDLNGTSGQPRYVYPADYTFAHVIAVGGSASDGSLAPGSSFGAKSVDLVAPAVSILSTTINGGYARDTGTSQATAFVTGAMGLLKVHSPAVSAEDMRHALFSSVKPVPALDGLVATQGELALDRLMSSSVPVR